MRRSCFWRIGLAVVIMSALSALGGCGGMKMESLWCDREITIDGIPDDWAKATTYVEDTKVALGVMNDEENLYLTLSCPLDNTAAQIVMRGFTVWFDPEGGKGKRFGINFPIATPMRPDSLMRQGRSRRDLTEFRKMIVERLAAASGQMEILGPGEDDRIMLASDQAKGIEVGLGHRDERLVYELKVPLHRSQNQPYAIEAEAGRRVGIGFETPEIDLKAVRESMAGDRPSGAGGIPGGGRPGGGPGGMGGGRPPGGPGRMSERLQIWAKVQLASGPAEGR